MERALSCKADVKWLKSKNMHIYNIVISSGEGSATVASVFAHETATTRESKNAVIAFILTM